MFWKKLVRGTNTTWVGKERGDCVRGEDGVCLGGKEKRTRARKKRNYSHTIGRWAHTKEETEQEAKALPKHRGLEKTRKVSTVDQKKKGN